MTTEDVETSSNLDRLMDNLGKVGKLSERLLVALANKRQINPNLQAPGSDLFVRATGAYWADMLQHPSKLFEQQASFWGATLKHYVDAHEALARGEFATPKDSSPQDPRFSNELWQTHPYFNYVKQQYFASVVAIESAIEQLDGLDAKDRQRVEYFARQIINMMAPTNFLGTNPEALTKAMETEGESLVKGLENLVHDIETNNGELLVTLADKDAFRVGENLAVTPGQVVFRHRLFELIQYEPQTETVHATPLVLFPPWINKFYILDLKPKTSLIRWLVEQGFTVFVVSWFNPEPHDADVGMRTYVEDGYLTAIDEVKQITGQSTVNVAGYCIGGTTLALTLALLNRRGDRSIRSATFFTTLTDFTDQGEMGVFLSNDFVDGIEQEVQRTGILESFFMTRTFSFLRSNDLVYRPAIRSYMLGEPPPAFDLLYWNGDGTNLPATMVLEYLRELCQENGFVHGRFEIGGERVMLDDIDVPLFAVACEADHIAAWKACFSGIRQMGSTDKTFVLSESGHIAGIVNPPSKKKYGHYTNSQPMRDPDDWKTSAEFHQGSWWPRWAIWLRDHAGLMVPSPQPGDTPSSPSLGPAPGTYVLVQSNASHQASATDS